MVFNGFQLFIGDENHPKMVSKPTDLVVQMTGECYDMNLIELMNK